MLPAASDLKKRANPPWPGESSGGETWRSGLCMSHPSAKRLGRLGCGPCRGNAARRKCAQSRRETQTLPADAARPKPECVKSWADGVAARQMQVSGSSSADRARLNPTNRNEQEIEP